jgi:hypothetical protein
MTASDTSGIRAFRDSLSRWNGFAFADLTAAMTAGRHSPVETSLFIKSLQ